jgi:hypothetical protein
MAILKSAFEQIHRRVAHEACDEHVGRPPVEIIGRRQLLQLAHGEDASFRDFQFESGFRVIRSLVLL